MVKNIRRIIWEKEGSPIHIFEGAKYLNLRRHYDSNYFNVGNSLRDWNGHAITSLIDPSNRRGFTFRLEP